MKNTASHGIRENCKYEWEKLLFKFKLKYPISDSQLQAKECDFGGTLKAVE
jgi:hypothetical protein